MMNLSKLQEKMKLQNIEALLVTRNNMFLGEDILPEENKIMELTNFSGSAGTLLVTQEKSWLFVDGRYHIQARQQTDPKAVEVVDSAGSVLNLVYDYCVQNSIKTLTYNPWCLSISDVEKISKRGELNLQEEEQILGPLLSSEKVDVFLAEYSGVKNRDKIANISRQIPLNADAMLICSADQVSWLTNTRSKTLPYTPVFRAFAVIDTASKARLFAEHCSDAGVYPFARLKEYLENYKGKAVAVDKYTTPQKILSLLPEDVRVEFAAFTYLSHQKLSKNPIELQGFVDCHIQDGIAVSKFLCWLDSHWKGLTELDVVEKLHDFRKERPLFFSESFATIAAVGQNAAVVHYQPTKETNTKLQENTVLLLDSGGQYLNGTTDVTRTIALKTPSDEIKKSFTQVLKAHIALASQKFPAAIPSYMLDSVARSMMWRFGKNYDHGTGHSVGHFSNVHEAPFGLSVRNKSAVFENYVTSNEPGYYEEGKYGIRIENMVYTRLDETKQMLCFENLTLIPIDKRLIDVYLLDKGERDWLNNYHQRVWDCLASYMDEAEKSWLESACSPI